MDLSKFDTRQKAEEGIDVELVISGETVFGDDEKPVTFRVKGMADPDVHQIVVKTMRTDVVSSKEAIESDMKLARVSIVGWSDNFTVDGKKVPYSKTNIEVVMGNPVVRKAVLAPIFDEARFMKGS